MRLAALFLTVFMLSGCAAHQIPLSIQLECGLTDEECMAEGLRKKWTAECKTEHLTGVDEGFQYENHLGNIVITTSLNSCVIGKEQTHKLAEFGFRQPIVVDGIGK